MSRISRFLVAIALAATGACAQDWAPMRIVAITDYPRLAWIARTTGDVMIRCYLDKEGSVVKAEVRSGPPLLGEEALHNAGLEGGPKDTPHSSFAVDLPNVVHVVAPTPVSMID